MIPRDPALLARAARFARVPGVLRAQAAARHGVSLRALRAALRAGGPETLPSRRDLVFWALTENERVTEGVVPPAESLASWCDYVNHDGTTPEEVDAILAGLASEGILVREGERWRLTRGFP